MKYLISSFLTFIFFQCFTQEIPKSPNITDQNGLRQGRWTILYDDSWTVTTDPSAFHFYRIIKYENDQPVGTVRDYYRSGQVQMEGVMLSDRPKPVMDGEVTYYDTAGLKTKVSHYKQGELLTTGYYEDGKLKAVLDANWEKDLQKAVAAFQRQKYEATVQLLEKHVEGIRIAYQDNKAILKAFSQMLLQSYQQLGETENTQETLAYIESFTAIEDQWNELHNQAKKAREEGRTEEALALYEQVIALAEGEFGTISDQYVTAAVGQAKLYKQLHMFTEAEACYQKAISSAKIWTGGEVSEYYLDIRIELADLFQTTGQYSKAEEIFLEVVALQEKSSQTGEDHARNLNKLGNLYYRMGRLSDAEAFYLQSQSAYRLLPDADRVYQAHISNNLGLVSSGLGKLDQSEKHYAEAMDVYRAESGEESSNYARVLTNLAMLYEQKALYIKSEALLLEALRIRRAMSDTLSSEFAHVLNNLSAVYTKIGKPNKAEPLLLQSLSLFKTLYGEKHPSYLTPMGNLASLYADMARIEKADSVYQQLLQLKKQALGEMHPSYATSLNNMAVYYQKHAFYQQALQMHQKALEIRREVLGEAHSAYATSLSNIGTIYEDLQQYDKAEEYYWQANEIIKKIKGETHPDLAHSLSYLAGLYKQLSRLDEAEELYLLALEIRENSLGNDHPQYWAVQLNLAAVYVDQARYTEAETLLKQATDFRRNYYGDHHPDYATALGHLAALYRDMNRYDEAEKLYFEELAINQGTYGKKHLSNASTLNNIGLFYQDIGQLAEAESYYLRAIDIVKHLLGGKALQHAIYLNNLAILYHEGGRLLEAEKLHRQVLEIRKDQLGERHPDYASSIASLAVLLRETGNFKEAEKLFIQAREVLKSVGTSHPSYAILLDNIAGLYNDMGHFSKAEPLYLEAMEIRKKAFGTNHTEYASSLNNVASFYLDMRRTDKAERLFEESAQIRKAVFGPYHPDYAMSLNNLASLYQNVGKNEKAEQYFLESLEIKDSIYGKSHPDYALSLNNLAALYASMKRNDEAKEMYLRSMEIRKQVYGENHLDYASALNNLATLYARLHNYDSAEYLFIRAREMYLTRLGKLHPLYTLSTRNLADFYEDRGRYFEAESLFLAANSNMHEQIRTNFINLSEKEKSQFYQRFKSAFLSFNSFALKYYPEKPAIVAEAFNNALAVKGLLFRSTKKVRDRILNSGDTALINKFQQWNEQRELISYTYSLSRQARQEQNLDPDSLENYANTLEKELSSRSAAFAKQTDHTRHTWKDVRKSLRRGEAAVEMIRFRYYDTGWTDSVFYMALLVRPDTRRHPEMILLRNGAELEGKDLKSYRNLIKFKMQDTRSYGQYWGALAEHLDGVKKLYFSADGVYHSISLNGLYNPSTGSYLADELNIQLVNSTGELVESRKKGKDIRDAHLFGYPDYQRNKQNKGSIPGYERSLAVSNAYEGIQRFFSAESIVKLPGTKVEVEKLEEMLQGTRIETSTYLAAEASEERIKGIRYPGVLHIATHGFFLEDLKEDAESKEMILGMSGDKVVENPLLRSGLLLANAREAMSSGGDGILTAYEAMNLHLDDTELVVLSACETGLGEVKNGEGVYGLQRAFRAAGAKTLIMSLWTVSDEATMHLMRTFYANWLQREQPKREAFINAQRSLREKYPHPYYWAAFVLVGE